MDFDTTVSIVENFMRASMALCEATRGLTILMAPSKIPGQKLGSDQAIEEQRQRVIGLTLGVERFGQMVGVPRIG